MKIFLFVTFLIPFLGFSQNINLTEIIEFQENNHNKIREVLLSRNWKIIQEMGGEDYSFGNIRFAFDDKSGILSNSYIIALNYDKENVKNNRIGFEIPTYDQYSKYVAELLQMGFNRTNVNRNTNEFWQIYQNYKFYIETVVRPVENYFGSPRTFYEIIITHIENPNPIQRK